MEITFIEIMKNTNEESRPSCVLENTQSPHSRQPLLLDSE
jgi:hypothetical protein